MDLRAFEDAQAAIKGIAWAARDAGRGAHVVTTAGEGNADPEAADRVFVGFRDRDRVEAAVIGWDVFDDVSVLKVDPKAHALDPVEHIPAVEVVPDAGAARAKWSPAPMVVIGEDQADALAYLAPGRRPAVYLIGSDGDDPTVWRRAVAIGAEHVVFLPED
jgi:hypothetical protein